MNSYERKELKRAKESKENWKAKAMDRNKKLRAEKVKTRDLEKSRDMWKQKYLDEKEKSRQNSLPAVSSNTIDPPSDSNFIQMVMISVCINLTINCCVSFRSIPKILKLFKNLLNTFGIKFDFKIPHFTTVIRWTLRVGAFLLSKAENHPLGQWICVMDHTIQVGKKKAFVVLKVPIEAMERIGALTLNDVDVLYVKVQDQWNGKIVQDILHQLFSRVGFPLQVVMDGGPDLNKGIKNILETIAFPFKVTYDITHFIAKLIKKKYKDHEIFNTMLSQMSKTKVKILQTALAHLMPLKDRSKLKFMSLLPIAKWTKQIIDYIESLTNLSEENQEERKKIMDNFSWIFKYKEFLTKFWIEINTLAEIQKILKKIGLNEITYKQVCTLLDKITDTNLKNSILEYLETEYKFASSVTYPILLTSDSIESLFGKYKYIAKPHCMSEINRMILSLPCICEDITPRCCQRNFFQYKK